MLVPIWVSFFLSLVLIILIARKDLGIGIFIGAITLGILTQVDFISASKTVFLSWNNLIIGFSVALIPILGGIMDKSNLMSETKKLKKQVSMSWEMIGESDGINNIKDIIERVAPTDARVLITGENGTGKEVAARVIHNLSPRVLEPFIAVNCAAIPEELIQSELFGHAKGAFTGASINRIGKFEVTAT